MLSCQKFSVMGNIFCFFFIAIIIISSSSVSWIWILYQLNQWLCFSLIKEHMEFKQRVGNAKTDHIHTLLFLVEPFSKKSNHLTMSLDARFMKVSWLPLCVQPHRSFVYVSLTIAHALLPKFLPFFLRWAFR